MAKGGHSRGKGKQLQWLRDHVDHNGEECLIWPFFRNHEGYGSLGYYGKVRKAHRVMCILANGEPPDPKLVTAHSCGNGHLGCVHPKHLSWKTIRQNRLDANRHGTGNAPAPRRLTIDQVEQIRASSKSYIELAAEFGVKVPTIGKIKRGATWTEPRSKLTLEKIKLIRDAPETAALDIGRALGVDSTKVRKLRAGISFQGIE